MKIVTLTVLVFLQLALHVQGGSRITAAISFDEGSYRGTEGTSLEVCLSLAQLALFPSVACNVTVKVRAFPLDGRNTANFDVDYTLNNGLDCVTVTFTPRDARSVCFNVVLKEDGIVEGNEVFLLRILAESIVVSGAQVCTTEFDFDATATAEVTILEGNDVVFCKFNTRQETVEEGTNKSVSLTASCRGRYQRRVAITVKCDPTSAEGVVPADNPDDFEFNTTVEFQFQFNNGSQNTSTSFNILTIPIIDDECAEPRESFICTLQSGSTQPVRSEDPEQVTIDIIDNDELVIRWKQNFYSFSEKGPATVELVTDSCIEVDFTIFGQPVEITDGIMQEVIQRALGRFLFDFSFNTVTFEGKSYGIASVVSAPNTPDVTETFNAFLFTNASRSAFSDFTHVDDNICEGDELYMATFNLDSNTISGFKSKPAQPNITYIAIQDDDRTLINFHQPSYCVTERDGHIDISVASTGAFLGPIKVNVSCFGGNATDDIDFEAGIYNTSFSVNSAISSIESFPIRINITNDNVDESDECFVCEITAVDGLPCAAIGNSTETQICIRKFCVPPVTINNETVVEGSIAKIRLELADTLSDHCSIKVQTMDETAVASRDYVSDEYTVEIPASERIAYLMVETIEDDIAELTEYFTARITQTCEASIISEQQNTSYVTILDNDTLFVMLETTACITPECDSLGGNATLEVALVASTTCEQKYTVIVTASDVTAKESKDYFGQSFNVTFLPLEKRVPFNITIACDSIAELDEIFTLQLEAPQNMDGNCRDVQLGTLVRTNCTIEDEDNITCSKAPENATVTEGGVANLTVNCSGKYEFDFTLFLDTMDGSAVAPGDYTSRGYSLSFTAGQTSDILSVTTNDDTIAECEEFFKVMITRSSLPEKVHIGDPNICYVNIENDDVQIKFVEDQYTVKEGEEVMLSLNITGCVSLKCSVNVTVSGGNALASSDFTGVPIRKRIDPRIDGLNFPFKAFCDNITEGTEYVELGLEIPSQNECQIEAIPPTTTRVDILDRCIPIPAVSTMPVNDSVIADPLYTVPLRTMNTSNIIEGTPLCYEVHGEPNHYFNLVSDDCTSVNAHYVAAVRPRAGNVIGQIGIVTIDRNNAYHQIQIDVTSDGQCRTQINGSDLLPGTTYNTSTGVTVMARRRQHYVRVSTLNCAEQDLVMWIRCHKPTLNQTGDSFEQPMIKFVVTRGLKTRSEAHGLIGQFWGVPVRVTPYTGGFLPHARNHSGTYYTLHFNATSPSQSRTFTAKLGWTTWRLNFIPTLPGYQCFYAGNSQGGPSIEATDPGVQDSVIEGKYQDYMTSGLFDTQWNKEFSQFRGV